MTGYTFEKDEMFNEIVEGLIFLKNSRPFCPPPLPLVISRRKRSRQITLQGIRYAKKEEEAQVRVLASNIFNGRKVGSAAKKKARTDSVPVKQPKYSIEDGGYMKLIFRRIPCSSSSEAKTLHHHLPPLPLC